MGFHFGRGGDRTGSIIIFSLALDRLLSSGVLRVLCVSILSIYLNSSAKTNQQPVGTHPRIKPINDQLEQIYQFETDLRFNYSLSPKMLVRLYNVCYAILCNF